MKILLFGDRGQLGKCIKKLNKKYKIYYASKNNLSHKNILKKNDTIKNLKIDLIINAKAYTDVEKAEIEKLASYELNANFAKNLSFVSKKNQIPLVHISSDFVYNGKSKKPYTELSKTKPVNYYGLTKLKGENFIKKIACKFIIIRTSKLFSELGDNFVKRMAKHVKSKKNLNYIDEEYFCPTYAFDLAKLILLIVPKIKKLNKSKIYNFTGNEIFTPYKTVKLIYQILLSQKKIKKIKIIKTQGKNIKSLTKRPKYCILSNKNINKFVKLNRISTHKAIKKVILSEN